MGIVVDASGVALYPCDRVADDSLKKIAVGRPQLAVCSLVLGRNSVSTNRKAEE